MKKIWIWAIVIVAAIAAAWWYFNRKQGGAGNRQTVQTTGSQQPLIPWFPGFSGFTAASLQNTTATVNAAFDSLKSIANNFGWNDGGNSRVAVSGSNQGGTQSSGSGAGVPVDDFNGYDDSNWG